MGSRRIGMLFCGCLLIAASTVAAEGRDWSVGYVVQMSALERMTTAMPYRRYPSERFIDLMSKPFAPVTMSSIAEWNAAYRDFRRPDPANVLPEAFRRPDQVRVGFSFRF